MEEEPPDTWFIHMCSQNLVYTNSFRSNLGEIEQIWRFNHNRTDMEEVILKHWVFTGVVTYILSVNYIISLTRTNVRLRA